MARITRTLIIFIDFSQNRFVRVARFPVDHWAQVTHSPNWARVYCGCQPRPTRVALHPGMMVEEVPERQPYVHWTSTGYVFEETWNIHMCSCRVVVIILLQIVLKTLSMRVILDLSHDLTKTRIYDLFHNCMWQSRFSEVNVHLVERCGRTAWLSNLNNFWIQFFYPNMSQGNFWRHSRWFKFFFVYDFSNFHPDNFRGKKAGSVFQRMMAFDRVW